MKQQFTSDAGTILIVDDEQKNIQVVGSILSAFGFDFMIASDGKQALERVKAKVPDLVLLDIYMPDMNGFQVFDAFQKIEGMPGIPVIFLSADNDKNTVVKALETGGVDYVAKPFNKAELLARVRTHIELKRTQDYCTGLVEKAEKHLEVMAHDLKNWIGSASFSAQLFSTMEGLPEKAERASRNIAESTGKALEFINEFLNNARASRAEIEVEKSEFDLVLVGESAVRGNFPHAQSKKIDLSFESDQPRIPVTSDRAAVSRILENLVTNAVKFSPSGSKITVVASDSPPSVSVSDEGPGFSPNDRENLFTPYSRLSAKPTAGEPSTGLGLSIVKQLSDQLGTELIVGNPEKGAEITLKF